MASRNGPRSPGTSNAGEAPDTALAAMIAELREGKNAASAVDVLWRHTLGQRVLELMEDPSKYGKKAVARVARALGEKPRALYSAAEVARAFARPYLQALMKRPAASGRALGWSQLLLLAGGVEDPVRREAEVEQALCSPLSVRQSKEILLARGILTPRSLTPRSSGKSQRSSVPELPVATKRFVSSLRRLAAFGEAEKGTARDLSREQREAVLQEFRKARDVLGDLWRELHAASE